MQSSIESLRDLNMVEYWRLKFQLSILLLLFVSLKMTTFIAVCKRSCLAQVGVVFVRVGYRLETSILTRTVAWECSLSVAKMKLIILILLPKPKLRTATNFSTKKITCNPFHLRLFSTSKYWLFGEAAIELLRRDLNHNHKKYPQFHFVKCWKQIWQFPLKRFTFFLFKCT